MQTFQADLAIVGAGGAGLRAAIAAAQANPNAKITLISKVYPMRSHTVAAEGGSAAVAQDHDSFEYHFHDTVAAAVSRHQPGNYCDCYRFRCDWLHDRYGLAFLAGEAILRRYAQ